MHADSRHTAMSDACSLLLCVGCTYGETGSGTEDSEAHTDYSDDDENDCEALYTGAMSNSTACPKVTEGE